MKRFNLLLASFGFVLGLLVPALVAQSASAAQIAPCNNDLAVSKQVKIPGGSFVDSPDTSSAPTVHVGDTVEWLIGVNKNLLGACEGTPNLHGAIVLHDTLPSGVTYVSSIAGAGSYDSSTNDWSFTSIVFSSASTIYLQITTTANQVGSFDNLATLSKVGVCIPEQETCEQVDYALGADDPFYLQKDQVTNNNSADAWINVQSDPQVLGASTSGPQVLADTTLTNTGTGTGISIVAGLFVLAALAVMGYGRLYRKKPNFKV